MKNKLKKARMIILYLVSFIIIAWTIATYYVEQEGPIYTELIGSQQASKRALVVFDPDPIYNLDEQICIALAEGICKVENWSANVSSISNAGTLELNSYDLYIICANTYNWSPDRATKNFIKDHDFLNGKKAVSVVVGSGSTKRANRILNELITASGGELIESRSFWLMKPNDEDRMKESNVKVATDMAREWAESFDHHFL